MGSYDVVVVGAGVAGLAVSAELAGCNSVLLVDRLPVVGGRAGYESALVLQLQGECRKRRVGLLLGTTAVKWKGDALFVVGPSNWEWVAARHLVVACGLRPATVAELGIVGFRGAGIYPATVALHLLKAGINLGNDVVVLGASSWARPLTAALVSQHARITLVTPDPLFRDPDLKHPVWAGWTPTVISGTNRVRSLDVEREGATMKLWCDAVMLGLGARPVRNIDGALRQRPDQSITHVQFPEEELSDDELVMRSETAATKIAAELERTAQ